MMGMSSNSDMKSTSSKMKILSVRDIAEIGLMTACLEAVKMALSAIPNVEMVTLLIILFTLYLGKKTLIAVWAFVGVECFVWGIGLWTLMYIYVWPVLVICTLLLKRFIDLPMAYVVLSAAFGLLFGAMCSLPYIFISGPAYAFTWWIAGIPYDILHCVANFILALILFKPLNMLLTKIKKGSPFLS